jgi:hypothetical protein
MWSIPYYGILFWVFGCNTFSRICPQQCYFHVPSDMFHIFIIFVGFNSNKKS